MPERTRFGGGAGGTGGSGGWATGPGGGRRLGENSGRSTVADSRSRDWASGLESVTLDESCAGAAASAPSAAVVQHNKKTALAVRRKYVMASLAAKTRAGSTWLAAVDLR